MSFTYATLKTAVENYCETAETTFVATLPTFIQEAEERILKNVELPVFRSNVTGTATADSPYLSTPTYALFDDTTFLLAPTPDNPSAGVNYTFELHYKYRPTSLTAGDEGGTTWLSDNAPDALLYGTLIEAATFLKIPEEAGQYEQRFQMALEGLRKLGENYGSKDEYRYDISRG